jgi:hypothetical protein
MTCTVYRSDSGASVVVVCNGRSHGWRIRYGCCPWCAPDPTWGQRRVAYVSIYGGDGGEDCICGECGSEWSSYDGDVTFGKLDLDERDDNIALVASIPDPKCWDCHDTGDTGMPGLDEPGANPCACGRVAR